MKQICTIKDIARLGTIMGVWAHPDDETFSMAGIIASAKKNGQKVIVVIATRGEAGVQDELRWPASRLAQIRTDESDKALNILGVHETCWLDYPDGNCNNVAKIEAVSRIAKLIEKYKPDSVMTFGPEGMTGHDDHKSVSDWTSEAVLKASSGAKIYHAVQTHQQYENMLEVDKKFNIFFNIDEPPLCERDVCDICLELNSELYDLKLAALRAMPSQTEAMLTIFANSLRLALGKEAFVEFNPKKA